MAFDSARRLIPGLVLLVALLMQGVPAAQIAPTPAGEAAESSSASALTPEQAQAIADLLRSDAARDALLGELDRLATPAAEAETSTAATPSEDPATPRAEDDADQVSFGRQIARTTQEIAQGVAEGAIGFWDRLKRAPEALDDAGDVSWVVIRDALIDLALVVVSVFAIFYMLRHFARRLYRSMGNAAVEAGAWRTGLIILVSVFVDAAVVVLSWAAGYALMLLLFGDPGSIGIRQTLFLNAFLLVELLKVIVRAILAPTTEHLRPISLANAAARTVANWTMIVVGILGYGQMLVVPIISQNVGWFAGRSISTMISLVAVAIAIALVFWYRRPVADWLRADSHRRGIWSFLAGIWHLPVLAYLLFLFAIVLTRPGGILFPLLAATGKVAGAFIVGAIVANLLRRGVLRGVSLPENINARLPLLERRLNSFVPRILLLLRLLIIVAVVAFAIDTVDLFDVNGWLVSQVGIQMTETILSVALLLLVAFAIWLALSSWIDYRLNPEFGSTPTAREQTLLTLLRNAATIVLVVITAMFALSEIGIDIAPLLASAGVLGLAIGFGAQKLVQDIITGIFIQFENAMNVGDVVTAGGTTGTVERLTIRSVSLRDVYGTFHIIPFSSVDMVSNWMRDYGNFVCDMGVAYREDIGLARKAMEDAFEELRADPAWSGALMGDLQWFGVQEFAADAVVLRARIKCVAGQQWAVGRAYNEVVKRIFDERGIEIPFPHRTLYFGEDRDGKAPALRLRTEEGGDKGPTEQN